jgi:F-type H+-transporting ATPase subunit epsilon
MAKTLLRVVTLDKTHFEKNVDMIVFDGVDGQIGVLQGHAPMTVALSEDGVLHAYDDDDVYVLYIAGGFAKITADVVTILAKEAGKPDEIDADRERKELEKAEQEMSKSQGVAGYIRQKKIKFGVRMFVLK